VDGGDKFATYPPPPTGEGYYYEAASRMLRLRRERGRRNFKYKGESTLIDILVFLIYSIE